MTLAYLHGEPQITGSIRNKPEDFYVEEQLGFEPSGQGEHLWLWVEKRGLNTLFVAEQLAKLFNISPRQISTSGMKDRHAVTKQWFSLPFPIKQPLPKNIAIDGVTVLKTIRHDKKLKTGTHKANFFTIAIKLDVQSQAIDKTELDLRLNQIKEQGVPNYFGEQRFGKQGNNLDKAERLFKGEFKVRDKKKRGIYLSAARSYIFNQIIHQRLTDNLFSPQDGEAFVLTGSRSTFTEDKLSDETIERYKLKDVQLSASLWGRGELRSAGELVLLEQSIAKQYFVLSTGLEDAGLKQERRSINLFINDLTWVIDENCHTVTLSFTLPTGCFATSVLREIVNYVDIKTLPKREEH